MKDEQLCEVCGTAMFQIGPYASIKREGEAVKMWNGNIDCQCENKECVNYLKIVKRNLFGI